MSKEYISKQCGEILHIYDPIYKQNYYYFCCKSHKDYQRIARLKFKIEFKDKTNTDGAFNVFEHGGIEVCFIWTKGRKVELIAHEISHAVSYVLRQKGLPLSDDTEEAYAYLTQFLMNQIIRKAG